MAVARLVGLRRLLALRIGGLLLGGGGVGAELVDDGVGSGDDPARNVPGLEFRQHRRLQDLAGEGVGEDRLQAVTHLDPHLMLGRHDDEEGAVVGPLLADAPGAAELIAVVGNLVALQVRQGHHHQLAGRAALQVGQLGGQRRLHLGRQHMGVVHHPPAQGREGQGGPGGGDRQRQEREGREQSGEGAGHAATSSSTSWRMKRWSRLRSIQPGPRYRSSPWAPTGRRMRRRTAASAFRRCRPSWPTARRGRCAG